MEEETTSAYLDVLLPEYQVINLAVSGWSVDQYYLYLRETIEKTNPRVVVVGVFAGNDFQVSARGYGWGHSKPLFKVEDDQLVHTNPKLLSNNCIDQMAQSLLFRPFWRNKVFAQKVLKTICRAEDLPVEEAEVSVEKLLDEIVSISRKSGADIVFLLLPDINDFINVGDYHYRYLVSFYPFFRDLFREKGYDYIDVAELVGRDADAMQRDIFIDQDHYTPQGHKLLADALYRHLKTRYLATP